MKLAVELVPSGGWYSSLRSRVGRLVWDGIRKKAYEEAGYKCCICGSVGVLYCHEVWQYDDVEHIQRLLGFEALCFMCYVVKRIGCGSIGGMYSRFSSKVVIEHFMKVNKCSLADYNEYVSLAIVDWKKRCGYRWKCELGEYERLVKKV